MSNDGSKRALSKPISASQPREEYIASSSSYRESRAASTARLASPIAQSHISGAWRPSSAQGKSRIRQGSSTAAPDTNFIKSEIHKIGPHGSRSEESAITAALEKPGPPRPQSPVLSLEQDEGTSQVDQDFNRSGSWNDRRKRSTRSELIENPEVVRRHLVQPNIDDRDTTNRGPSLDQELPPQSCHGPAESEFSSLRLQGGDIHREIYRWSEGDQDSQYRSHPQRSKSWHLARHDSWEDSPNLSSIHVPGGFRREHLRRNASQRNGRQGSNTGHTTKSSPHHINPKPGFLSRNFLEFLTLYGHFAGEELDEDEYQENDQDEFFGSASCIQNANSDDDEPDEGSALLTPRTPGLSKRWTKERGAPGTTTPVGAALLLLKSFMGTGVLFLPRAYLNGGMLFSNIVLLCVAGLSYYCFILLVESKVKCPGSFGDIGHVLYGTWMRSLILASVVLSQIGFVSAYIVFTSENLQAFVLAVSRCRSWIDIKFMVLMQLILFLPLSLIRDIGKLGATALVADFFILLGLLYLAYYDIWTIVSNHGVADIVSFNPNDWTLFIGTAIFTFEGVGLILPIEESMKDPRKFPSVLAGVMLIITVLFVGIGALSYAAFGSATKTVVLLNLPQESRLVNVVQLLYSLAILLSTPLQLFPAIRIMESELFSHSGKDNSFIKWKKNIFRFVIVVICALIAWGGAADLDKFVSLVGSFACVPLIYVYPAMLHYKAVANTKAMRFGDMALGICGFAGMIYTTALTLHSWASSPSQVKQPGYCS